MDAFDANEVVGLGYTVSEEELVSKIAKIADDVFLEKLVESVKLLGVNKDQVFQYVYEVFEIAGKKMPSLKPYEVG